MAFNAPRSAALLRLSVTKTWSWHKNSPRTINTKSTLWKKMRQQVLQRDDCTCRFCGVRSGKYMVCDHIDGNPSHNDLSNLGINCPMCDSVRHCGLAGIHNLLSLGISKMPQKDINLKTLQLFSETHKVPLFSEVDSSAVIVADRTIGYANILLKLSDDFDYTSKCDCSSIPHDYSMHKGFFKADSTTLLNRILDNRF
ncbi:intracellular multiplication protein IcmJ [Entomortierella parvispora]|uniref:Intracellular multiplication protein IcmJ n=1 Tax=Entomortierella parvispora TaxID=205924 RepID=A0A9P3H7H1_9FUNG|nr:intracellular multiplication protein IcmJ [Entomortierella parvispora]